MGLSRYAFSFADISVMHRHISGKVALIKQLRESFLLGLKEAKDIADSMERVGWIELESTVRISSETYDKFRYSFGVLVRLLSHVELPSDDIQMVFVVRKNSDTTEGRGPMVVDSIFSNRKAAAEYVDVQPGIMGRKGKWSEEKNGYGDWQIEEVPLFVSAEQKGQANIAEQKTRALAKLTPFERTLLGL